MSFYEVSFNEQDEITNILFPGVSDETISIGSRRVEIPLAKSALNAATNYFRLGDYNHPDTQPGLHLFAETDPNALIKEIGYISVEFAGEGYPLPNPDLFPLGWAPLVQRGRLISIGRFAKKQGDVDMGTSKHAWNTANKHLIVDLFLQGKSLDVTVNPFRQLAEHHIAIWDTEDDEEARELSNDHYFSAVNYDRVVRGGYRKGMAVEAGKAEPTVEKADGILMRVKGGEGELVDMFEQPRGSYKCCDHRGGVDRNVYWDAGNRAILEQWKQMSKAKWQVTVS